MTSPHIAHTVEDVRRLAPTEGWYWVRARRWSDGEVVGAWRPLELKDNMRLAVPRWWDVGRSRWEDDDMVGHEIIGPIPEPGT